MCEIEHMKTKYKSGDEWAMMNANVTSRHWHVVELGYYFEGG